MEWMKRLGLFSTMAAALAVGGVTLTGCEEDAGDGIEDVGDDTDDALDDAADNMDDAADDAGDAMEDATN